MMADNTWLVFALVFIAVVLCIMLEDTSRIVARLIDILELPRHQATDDDDEEEPL